MLSAAKLTANRRNARKSTGPRTDAGKAKSSLNAVQHGILSGRDVLLPGEVADDLETLRQSFIDSLAPTDAIEMALVERMILARWKIRRVRAAERKVADGLIVQRTEEYFEEYRRQNIYPMKEGKARNAAFDEIKQRAKLERVAVAQEDLQLSRLKGWERLSAYEHRLENSFYKALRELRLLRKDRATQNSDPDADVDETVPAAVTQHFDVPPAPVSRQSDDPDSPALLEARTHATSICTNEPTAAPTDATSTPTSECIERHPDEPAVLASGQLKHDGGGPSAPALFSASP